MDGGIKFDVSANTARFDADMARVANSANTASAKIQQAFSGLGGILAGGAALAGLKTLMNDFDKVAKVATRFGASAEEIQRVSVAADLAGTNIDTVARVLTKMSVAASDASSGNEAMAKAFERAGISAEQFKNSGLDQQLIILSEAFNRARGNADATNQIIELMGTRAASQMIPLIDNTAALRQEMEGVSVASDDVVRKIEAANDRLTRLGNDGKVALAGLIEGFVSISERLGNVISDSDKLIKLLAALSLAVTTGNVKPFWEVLQTGKTIAELEEIEARATAISQLTREGVFGMDAVRNAELIAERTKEILEQTRGTTQQIGLAEDMTERVVDLEKQKTAELDRQAEQLERQERQRQDAIRSMEAEIALIEAKLSGNKALEESLREQADFQAALSKTGSFETAANFAATKAAERASGESSSARLGREFAEAANLYGPRGGARPMTEGMKTAALRGEARANDIRQRGNELADAGMFRSAVRTMARADRTAARIMDNQRVRDFYRDEFGAGNAGEAFRDFRNTFGMDTNDLIKKGLEDMGQKFDPQRDLQSNFDRLAREQAKTPEERAAEEEAMRQKHAPPGGGGGGGAAADILKLLRTHLPQIDKKLPQHALVAT
jgi:ribosomal protein L12E/L44/L45/RPP1/RPP2